MSKSIAISLSSSLESSNGLSLIDTHSHLFWDSYREDFEAVIKRAVESGVTTAVNVGVNVEKSRMAADLKTDNSQMKFYSSIGIHPHEAGKYSDKGNVISDKLEKDISVLEQIYSKNPDKVIAVGECGLDYLVHPDYNPSNLTIEQLKQLQRKLFKAQIDLAKKLSLPVLVHCRDDRNKDFNNTECWDKVVKMTQGWKGIYHCYSGLLPTTNSIIQNSNFLISFAGNLTYPKNDYLKEAVRILPLERIVLETDCPFLPPQSIRGQRNEPSSVMEIAQTIAEIKNEPFEKVVRQTTENFQKLFNLQTVN